MEHPALEGMEGGCNTAPPSSLPPQVTSTLHLHLPGGDSMWFVAVWMRRTLETHIGMFGPQFVELYGKD